MVDDEKKNFSGMTTHKYFLKNFIMECLIYAEKLKNCEGSNHVYAI